MLMNRHAAEKWTDQYERLTRLIEELESKGDSAPMRELVQLYGHRGRAIEKLEQVPSSAVPKVSV